MGGQKDKHSTGLTIAIVLILIAIIIVAFLLFSDSASENRLSCKATLESNLSTNGEIKIKVVAYGGGTIQTEDGINTNQNSYEKAVSSNGQYKFYAVNGSSKEVCTIAVTNIDKTPPTASISASNEKREIAIRLTIKASDDIGLPSSPYSWDAKKWTSTNYLIVTSNGRYTAYVRDKAGNIATTHYTVNNIGNPTITEKISMYTNNTKVLKVEDGKVKTWKSNNSSVATVDNNGKVTTKIAGTATITAILDNGDIYEFIITVTKTKVTSISLNTGSSQIKKKETLKLSISKINPSNASCDNITWSSSNTAVAQVNAGVVTGVSDGSAVITASCDGITAKATITVKSIDAPIVPTSGIVTKYEGSTLKYYVVNKGINYLTYIWMEDPYNQIKKLDSMVSKYGKVLTDSEINSAGYGLVRRNVGEMMNSYISFGIIPAAKAAIGYNASGFYVKGAWEPPSDYYNNRSGSWLVLTDGKLTRSRITEDGAPTKTIIGINPSGDLKIYNGVSNASARQTVYNSVMADQIKNTWSFGPVLVKNGTAVSTDTTQAKRQAICQVNSNNYIMLTTIYNSSYDEMAKLFVSLGCKTAFNFDGGGSTSLFYKKPGTTGVTKLNCSDGSTHDQCRAIVEGIYFIEK